MGWFLSMCWSNSDSSFILSSNIHSLYSYPKSTSICYMVKHDFYLLLADTDCLSQENTYPQKNRKLFKYILSRLLTFLAVTVITVIILYEVCWYLRRVTIVKLNVRWYNRFIKYIELVLMLSHNVLKCYENFNLKILCWQKLDIIIHDRYVRKM